MTADRRTRTQLRNDIQGTLRHLRARRNGASELLPGCTARATGVLSTSALFSLWKRAEDAGATQRETNFPGGRRAVTLDGCVGGTGAEMEEDFVLGAILHDTFPLCMVRAKQQPRCLPVSSPTCQCENQGREAFGHRRQPRPLRVVHFATKPPLAQQFNLGGPKPRTNEDS